MIHGSGQPLRCRHIIHELKMTTAVRSCLVVDEVDQHCPQSLPAWCCASVGGQVGREQRQDMPCQVGTGIYAHALHLRLGAYSVKYAGNNCCNEFTP